MNDFAGMTLTDQRAGHRGRTWVFVLLLLALLGGGTLLVALTVFQTHRRMSEELLGRATRVARGINTAYLEKLSGTDADLDSPAYQRVKSYLMAVHSDCGACRFVFLMGRDPEGTVFISADSEPPDSEDYSPPGDVFHEADAAAHLGFDEARAGVYMGLQDRWGEWVSAYVPVLDDRTGQTVAVLGIDVAADNWHRLLLRSSVPPSLLTLVLVLITCVFASISKATQHRTTTTTLILKHSEIYLILLLILAGAILTAYAASMTHQAEQRKKATRFHQLAEGELRRTQLQLEMMRDLRLPALARFLELGQDVTADDFRHFVGIREDGIKAHSWGWVPLVTEKERAHFESRIAENEGTPNQIWEQHRHDEIVAAAERPQYYPLHFVAPAEHEAVGIGYDLGSDPLRRAAIEAATRSGKPTATTPLQLVTEPPGTSTILVVQPVYVAPGTDRLRGFVTGTIHLEELLRGVRETSPLHHHLYLVSTHETQPQRLTEPCTEEDCSMEGETSLSLYTSLFGQTFRLTAHPPEAWHAGYRARTGWMTGAAGILMTLMVTLVVSTPLFQRRLLAQLVKKRTDDLETALAQEKKSRQELALLSTAIEQSPETVIITDACGVIEYVNPAFSRITQYRRDEALGKTPRLLKSGKHEEKFYKELWNTISSGKVWQGRMVNLRKNGEIYTEEASIAPVVDDQGTLSHYVAIKRDITEQLVQEENLQQSQKMDTIGRLAGGVAHDFNNLLGVILGNVELALETIDSSDSISEELHEIRKAASRSADLTRQLLAFSRKQAAHPKVIDMNDTIGGMLKMLQRIIGENIDIDWRPGSPGGRIFLDPSQLDQILVNLCVNARDAIEDTGHITIKTDTVTLSKADCSRHDGAAPGNYVLLSVSDTGKGIDPEMHSKIFEPFFTTKQTGKGTGLGLATVYGIVMQNNGFIDIDSTPGRGTTLVIHFPQHDEMEDTSVEAVAETPVIGGHETILLVEDELSVLNLVRQTLIRYGYTILSTTKPEEAVRISREHAGEIDLLLTDVVMPQMNGRELATTIAALRPGITCVFMSGYSNQVISENGVMDKSLHFIQKPFLPAELAQLIRRALSSSTPASEPPA